MGRGIAISHVVFARSNCLKRVSGAQRVKPFVFGVLFKPSSMLNLVFPGFPLVGPPKGNGNGKRTPMTVQAAC